MTQEKRTCPFCGDFVVVEVTMVKSRDGKRMVKQWEHKNCKRMVSFLNKMKF